MKVISGNTKQGHASRGFAESMTKEQLDKLLSADWLKKMVAEIRGGNEGQKDNLPYICPHYAAFRNNHRAQADIIPEAFTFMTCVDVDDKELVDKAIQRAMEVNKDEYSDWQDQVLRIEYSARKKVHIYIRIPKGMTIEEAQQAFCKELGIPYDESCITPERFIYVTGKDEEVYRSEHWLEPLSEEDIAERREIFLQRGLDVDGRPLRGSEELRVKSEEFAAAHDNSELTTNSQPSPLTSQPSETSLTAFDLCVEQAGLKPGAMDVWGEHNWHSNLMAVLSVGVGKLMSREQLLAVVAERLPNYSQTEDCRKLIDYFYEKYSADKGFMSASLRDINAKAQEKMFNGQCSMVNETDAERDLAELTQGWNPPELPQKLPRLIALLIKPFPEVYHPMLVVTACVVLGAIASHYRSTYIDGRTIAANLYAAIIAGSGKGKHWVTKLLELMCRNTLQTWDDAEWQKVRENQEMRDRKSNAKDKPAKYHPRLRIMETMSKTSLLEVQTNLGENGMLLCNYTESDELANASRAQFSNISVLLRKAWDMDIHRQFYMSEASCSTQCRLCAAILLTGTPKSVLSRLFTDTENGMMQRFLPMMMPSIKRTFRPPVFTPLPADEEAERDALLASLWQKDLSLGDGILMLEMPKTQKMIQEWYNELEERYAEGTMTEAEADLSHRVGQFMQRAAIPFVALYGEEQKEVIDLVRWLGDFAYYNICHIFASRVAQDLKESEQMLQRQADGRITAEPLLNHMPDIFTLQQFREERIRQGQSSEVKVLLSRYCKSGKIERIEKGVYRKLKVKN